MLLFNIQEHDDETTGNFIKIYVIVLSALTGGFSPPCSALYFSTFFAPLLRIWLCPLLRTMILLRIALPPPLFVAEPLTPHDACVPDSAPCCAPFFPKLAVPLSPYLGVRLDLPLHYSLFCTLPSHLLLTLMCA